ncbi:unnamed protein product [Microthlaspi erraticum]|uniref:Uncharacterized protein n=1 Tax=Microthlaspi erraticum TaxID=1685480 RepID=A0A6D2KQ26_9BRAS|nr:unnamed protein product [Microthlaspi erraticum]
MQKSMDKMVSKIKSLEKKVSGSSSKKKKSKAPTFLGVDLSHHSKEAPCPRASQSLFFRAKGRRRQLAEKEEDFQGQTLQLDHGLDRVQTEETQLDRADGRVDLEEPLCMRILGFEYDQRSTRTSPSRLPTTGASQLHQGQGSHTHFEEEGRRGAASSIE